MKLNRLAAVCAALPLAACATNDQLMFVSQNTFGVKVGVGADSQPITFAVGYDSYDGAMMPAIMRNKDGDDPALVHGQHRYCGSTNSGDLAACVAAEGKANAKGDLPAADALGTPQNGLVVSEDALSVVSSFGSDNRVTASNSSVSSKLGKVFATGVSAQRIAEGLKTELSYANAAACVNAVNAISGLDAAAKSELIKAKC